jgi:hypothetical protein
MRKYFNNGVSFSDCGEQINVGVGEIFFDHIPTTEELVAAFPEHLTAMRDAFNETQRHNREVAYRIEADGLFFKSQRNEGTLAEWQAKVDEIKQRYPYESA